MGAVAQEGKQWMRGWGMKSQLRNQLGKRNGCRASSGNIPVFQTLFLAKMGEVCDANPVAAGSGLKIRYRRATGEQGYSQYATQQHSPRDGAFATGMGTSGHKECF